MEPWLISLIVILVVLFVVLPSIFFSISGFMTIKMMKKSKSKTFNVKGVDISFYEKGPHKPMAAAGVEYLKTLKEEDVYITSYDGYKLKARYYKNPNVESNKYFLGIHGFKSHALYEYGPYVKKYIEMGYNLLLPSQRAHDDSEGKYLTMGIKERYDVKSWADYIVKQHGEDVSILIQGVSMGGASVCLASNLDLPKQVVGIVSDCAYANVKEMMKWQMKKFAKLPLGPLMFVINIYLKLFVGINLNSESPLEAVSKAKVPMIFFHGEKDQMVPVEFAKQLYEACNAPKKKLIINKDANHAETIAYEGENYYNQIKETFNL